MLFTTTAELIRLEGILSFELSATMLWDEAFSHLNGELSVLILALEVECTALRVVKMFWIKTQCSEREDECCGKG